jgi:hypothetical protein
MKAEVMNNIKELDPVAFTRDLPEHGLKRGDVGAAVMVHNNGAAFEVEFVRDDGHTCFADVGAGSVTPSLLGGHSARTRTRVGLDATPSVTFSHRTRYNTPRGCAWSVRETGKL